MDVEIVEKKPSPEEYNTLRKQVGWEEYDESNIKEGLNSTLYCLCVYAGQKIIGMGRVIGDGKLVFYIQDIIVIPDYQKKKIGNTIMTMIMKYIDSRAVNNSIIGLMSAYGKEAFYESFGFIKRPSEHLGCGMTVFISRKSKKSL